MAPGNTYGPTTCTGATCDSTPDSLNHGVLAVGYGWEPAGTDACPKNETSGCDYWIIKNSWSAKWGENGYIKYQKGPDLNLCGIATCSSWCIAG